MGIKVVFQLKMEGKLSIPVLDYKLDFKADAKAIRINHSLPN